jgi:hypothetical protein
MQFLLAHPKPEQTADERVRELDIVQAEDLSIEAPRVAHGFWRARERHCDVLNALKLRSAHRPRMVRAITK